MSSRFYCWRNGHDWGPIGRRVYENIFGVRVRLQHCRQCQAARRWAA